MTSVATWAESVENKTDVEVTLKELGYDESYISLVKRIFQIDRTPVSKVGTTEYLTRDADLIKSKVGNAEFLSFTHTGQEVYPFGRSSLHKVNRIASGESVLLGSTASNCVSTFKVIDIHMRCRNPKKHVVMTCDTTFTNIMREIPGSTVTGDARSFVVLDGELSDEQAENDKQYQLIHVSSDTYSQHFGGAWEDPEFKKVYEKEYTSRIVSLISSAAKTLNIDAQSNVMVLPHNVNIYTWNAIGKKLNRPNTEILTQGIPEFGHCFGSDAFINLCLAEKMFASGKAEPDYIFCVTAGVGGFFSLIVLSK